MVSAGPLTTVQDLGRPGYAHLGVGRAGAADQASLARANALVGNPTGAAALEATLRGPRLRFAARTVLAVCGGQVACGEGPHELSTGGQLDVGAIRPGLRVYVAVRGGWDVPPVLGSRSTDTRSRLGPPPVRDGDLLPVGAAGAGWSGSVPPAVALVDVPTLHVYAGPREDAFVAGAIEQLCTANWTVTPSSDRSGLRLAGPPLRSTLVRELPSEGMVLGAVQVPPDGAPILFLADHPTTGGYPVLAVMASSDIALAAQARPGSRLRFALA